MSRNPIREYLDRVEELELKLTGKDKDTLDWLVFGFNACAKLLNQTEDENQQLNDDNFKIQARADRYKCKADNLQSTLEEIREYINTHIMVINDAFRLKDTIAGHDILQIIDKGVNNEL